MENRWTYYGICTVTSRRNATSWPPIVIEREELIEDVNNKVLMSFFNLRVASN